MALLVSLTKEVSSIVETRVVDGTMEFNKRPGPEVFTNSRKTSPPRSERYRKLQANYARQQVVLNPANAELQAESDHESATAENQKAEPRVISPQVTIGAKGWIIGGLSSIVLIVCAVCRAARQSSRR